MVAVGLAQPDSQTNEQLINKKAAERLFMSHS
jgi:hypothetical protein